MAVAGQTIFRPAWWWNQASTFSEWYGPPPTPPPFGQRTTMGTAQPMR